MKCGLYYITFEISRAKCKMRGLSLSRDVQVSSVRMRTRNNTILMGAHAHHNFSVGSKVMLYGPAQGGYDKVHVQNYLLSQLAELHTFSRL